MDIKNVAGFEWDDGNTGHCQKHGVTLGETEEVFSNTPRVSGNPFVEERRFRAIGRKPCRAVYVRRIYVPKMERRIVHSAYFCAIYAQEGD